MRANTRSYAKSNKSVIDYAIAPDKDAARHLAQVARRYTNDRANSAEVQDAYKTWIQALLPVSRQ